MRTVLAVTGTRADYGILRPVFRALEAHAGIRLRLVVTGMHLSPAFGRTVEEIRRDGFVIAAELDTLSKEDTPAGTRAFAEATLQGCTAVFMQEKPDIVLVLGDRTEMLAAAEAAHALHIPVAHLHGGETSGSLDDAQRHAITQLASIHLTSAEPHAALVRSLKPDEDPARIFVVGAPALDVIHTLSPVTRDAVCARYGFDPALPLLLFVQHPDTLEVRTAVEQLRPSLEALKEFSGSILIIGANADAGGRGMNNILSAFAKEHPHCVYTITLTHEEYLQMQSVADVLVGNSSSGIIESASFRLPVVNIGNRQQCRTRSGNVIDVPYDTGAITAAIDRALHNAAFRQELDTCVNAYGNGRASARIAAILSDISLPKADSRR